jgi:hypothetical protein
VATLAERKAALEDALYQGALNVTFPDRSAVTYRSVEELRQALALVNGEIATEAGTAQPRRLILSPSSGIEC